MQYALTYQNAPRIPLRQSHRQLNTVHQCLPHTPNRSPNPALTRNTVDVPAQNRTRNTPWLSLSGTHGAHSCTRLCQGRLPGTPHSIGQSVPSGVVGTGQVQGKSKYCVGPSECVAWREKAGVDCSECVEIYLFMWTYNNGLNILYLSRSWNEAVSGSKQNWLGNKQYWHVSPWASYQIRKIAGYACAGIAGNVFPAADFKWYR